MHFRTYVISLPSRKDRREALLANWNDVGISTDIAWIDGIRPSPEEILWSEMKGMEAYGRAENLRGKYVIGAVGCKRAGCDALSVFLDDENEWGLICQDDCHFIEGAPELIEQAVAELPDDADLLYLSAHSRKKNRALSQRLMRLGGARNCTAIFFRRGYTVEMLPRLMDSDCEWDLFMEHEHAKAAAYCVTPMPAFQARSFSDIVGMVVRPPNR